MGAYLIPQAMAYGSLAGVSPSTSLTIAAIPLVVYMLLGRNPYMSLGPESTVALIAPSFLQPTDWVVTSRSRRVHGPLREPLDGHHQFRWPRRPSRRPASGTCPCEGRLAEVPPFTAGLNRLLC